MNIATFLIAGILNICSTMEMDLEKVDSAMQKQNRSVIVIAVYMVTYNHENCISQAIERVINQKTKYSFKLFIGEDCSTDATKEICLSYQKAYPELIEVISTTTNNLKQNVNNIFDKCFNSSAKYIAMCEGDDYWTDENKLQRQVDFLEANPDYSICFSGYEILNEFNNTRSTHTLTQHSIDIETMIAGNSYSTATVVFKAEFFKPVPSWFSEMVFGDWSLYLAVMHASKKKAYCLNDITAVYRIHAGGIHGSSHASTEKLVKAYKQHIDFYRAIKENLFKTSYSELIDNCIKERKKIIAELLKKDKRIVAAALSKFY
ncbi:MAG TPA: glycosyltransferase [Parafilimonas sp.]|nr:glycosyltransferase [Parafilimonas sp.]